MTWGATYPSRLRSSRFFFSRKTADSLVSHDAPRMARWRSLVYQRGTRSGMHIHTAERWISLGIHPSRRPDLRAIS